MIRWRLGPPGSAIAADAARPSIAAGRLARPASVGLGSRAWPWQHTALGAILLLSAALRLAALDREGYGNTYYAAAVKSMLTSWHNLFFAAFDSAGFVAVDKPPLGLWLQAASAKLLGFSGLSLLLPQALAGLLSVGLLYYLVRRAFGATAGLLAALALAGTPISVVTDRNNTMDSQLVFVLLLAAWAATHAAESGRLRPLLAGATLVGLGYNIKMLQAYPVLPGFGLAYLLWAPLGLRSRLGRLALATVLLLAVSLSWSAVVDLTRPGARPYVGSSGTNSALSLALGYNGLGRLTEALATRLPALSLAGLTIDLTVAPAFAPQIGPPGPLRMLQAVIVEQAGWLLPLAVLGLFVAGRQAWPGAAGHVAGDRGAQDEALVRQRVGLTLWGGWLIAWVGYFSFARFYHLYYLVMLGPAVAALAGIGLVAGWRAYRRGGWWGWALPLELVGTTALQWRTLALYPAWSTWLTPVVLVLGLAAAAALVARRPAGGRLAAVAATVGSLTLLIAPAVWADLSVRAGNGGGWLVQAGPAAPFGALVRPAFGSFGGGPAQLGGQPPSGGGRGSLGGAGPPGGGPGPFAGRGSGTAFTFAGDQWNSLDPTLVRYLQANQGAARFLVATPTSSYASLFMLVTDQPAMALGGYQGWDRILTPARLAEQVANGTVRFFLLSAGSGGPRAGAEPDPTADLAAWVRSSCAAVPAERWQTNPGSAGSERAGPGPGGVPGRGFGPSLQSQQLYDCAQVAARSS